jgi:hypothetical protein
MGVGGREEHLVLIKRDASIAAIEVWRSWADAVFPDQLTGPGIQRLHNIVGVGKEDDAVMDDWGHFVGAPLVHRPSPFELQILDVVGVDLLQRAETPSLIVAAEHEPIAICGMFQHGVGNRPVGRYLPGDAETALIGRSRRRVCQCPELSGELAVGDIADLHIGGAGERLAARRRAIGFEQESHDVLIGLVAEAAALAQWHGCMEIVVEFSRRTIAPGLEKISIGKGGRFAAAR